MRVKIALPALTIAATYQEAFETKLLLANGIEEFVKLVLARADFHRRIFDDVLAGERQPEEVQVDPIDVLLDGIKKIKRGLSARRQPC